MKFFNVIGCSLLMCILSVEFCLANDPYKILGVDKKATKEQIRKAYKKQALRYHPDKNKGDKEAEKKFIELNKAYDVLKDPNLRRQYDMGGAEDDGNSYNNFHQSHGTYYGGNPGSFDSFEFHFEPHFRDFGRNPRNMDFKDFFAEFDDLTNFHNFFGPEKKHGKDKKFSNDKSQHKRNENRGGGHYANRFDFLQDDPFFDFFDHVPHDYTASSHFHEFKGNDKKDGSSGHRRHKVCRTVTTNVDGIVTTYTECS